jgi:DNA helicase II / ATP-dependent DNA helicase PcrA
VLQSVPIEDVARATSSLLAEALGRLRAGQVMREAGYDGEYGVIRLFEERELKRLTAGDVLFDAPVVRRKKSIEAKAATESGELSTAPALLLPLPKSGLPDFGINDAQVGQARPAWERDGVRGSSGVTLTLASPV